MLARGAVDIFSLQVGRVQLDRSVKRRAIFFVILRGATFFVILRGATFFVILRGTTFFVILRGAKRSRRI